MKTTLLVVVDEFPGGDLVAKLLKRLNKTKADEEELDVMEIHGAGSITAAVWSLRCFDFEQYGAFLKELAEGVTHVCEDSGALASDVLAVVDSGDPNIAQRAREAAADAHASGCCFESCSASTVVAAVAGAFASPHNKGIYAIDACVAAAHAHTDGWDYVDKLFSRHFGIK